MGLSLSLMLSAWNQIPRRNFLCSMGTVGKASIFQRKDGEMGASRSSSFKEEDSETTDKSEDGSEKVMLERSLSFNDWDSNEGEPGASGSSKNLDLDSDSSNSISLIGKGHKPVHITMPKLSVPQPVVFFSPRPVCELDAAATKLQKVYKSYRTRRNLADCAVVVEELWWKTLDSAALKRCSVSFFDAEKHETAISRWARARTRAAKVGKGLCKNEKAQKLALQHWLEAIDPRHRYGHNLHLYYDSWSDSRSSQPFFYWLDVGDGKELNLEKCPRINLQRQCITYLGPKEREAYEVTVEDGKLVYRQTGMFVDTTEDSKWIFVLSASRAFYVGQKKKGLFQHSSFLSGGATTAAGRLVAHDGVLEAIWPYSGHYLPTEDNFKEFISYLEKHNVDLTNVKRCAMDDDKVSFKEVGEESNKPEVVEVLPTITVSAGSGSGVNEPINNTAIHRQSSRKAKVINGEAPVFDISKRLSCKWTSGFGPRIGCVRDYPADLQSLALEQVNLSPKVSPGHSRSCLPIPSPRPSPKIRVSPRLAYMGLPSPRVALTSCS